ncbi:HAD-IA family hydrolase [Cellulomonas sp. P22]|uniref:HAD-IA family hydrolase n=1 Tax=Cellulomonas sp. P22 TaxID=3373189 RepID=UPI00378771FB
MTGAVVGSGVGAGGRVLLEGRVFEAVLFDMDGTLVSSTAAVERSWRQLGRELDIPALVSDGFAFHGMPAADTLDVLLADRDARTRALALERIAELEVADTEGVVLLPGVRAALDLLVPAGLCAVVTSCGTALAEARLGAGGVRRPVVVVTRDDVARGKPDPEPFVRGAQLLGVDPARCLVVEDAPAGLLAGRRAGATTLGLATTHPADELDADLVVADLGAVHLELVAGGVRVVAA